ncbi:MAG: rhomboid family intramembrane serine protease, partial [Bacteroidota bacterium]
GDLWHLIFNMFAVWMFGVNLELRWGTKRFLQFYFICLVGAGIAQLVVTGLSGAFYPTVGASGAVFGILLAFGVLFPNAEIYIYFILPVKAKYFVLFYGLFELFAGVTNLMPQVAHFAHLGGMVAGGAVLWWWRRSRRSRGQWTGSK